MHDPARDALIQIISEYGASIINTPKSLATLLRQQAKVVPRDVDTLLTAAQNTIPTTIQSNPHYDPESLARVLIQQAHMTAARANWAVRTWIAALDQSAKPLATAPRGATTAGAIFAVVGALAVGAMAYLIFAR
jgi:hypothetical protein